MEPYSYGILEDTKGTLEVVTWQLREQFERNQKLQEQCNDMGRVNMELRKALSLVCEGAGIKRISGLLLSRHTKHAGLMYDPETGDSIIRTFGK